jgi:hypothetical protein
MTAASCIVASSRLTQPTGMGSIIGAPMPVLGVVFACGQKSLVTLATFKALSWRGHGGSLW